MDSLVFMLRNRGLEGRVCVCVYVSWLSGPNCTLPSLCAGRVFRVPRQAVQRAGRDAPL